MAGSPSTVSLDVLAGTQVRVTATFVAVGQTTPGDPATVAFKVRTPHGVTTTYTYGTASEATKVSTGVYQLLVTVDARGIWWFQYKGSGGSGIVATGEVAVNCDGSAFL